jgi:CrcB protein
MEWLAVFLGGGLGSMLRYSITRLMQQKGWDFPWATLLANILSCIVLGILIGALTKLSPLQRMLWMVGFCGGFSTFSTFTAETYQLLQDGNYYYAIGNILISIIICIIALIIGVKISTAIL